MQERAVQGKTDDEKRRREGKGGAQSESNFQSFLQVDQAEEWILAEVIRNLRKM